MKKIFFTLFVFAIVAVASAQMANPVSWNFVSKRVGDGEFEITMTATIQSGWHLYSQTQPKDAIAIPTAISFNKNPLIDLDGKITEEGKLEKFTDKELGISANQYSKQVVFTQKVKLKGKARTALTGKVEFQTCDDKKCLPPKTVHFVVAF